MYYAEIPMYYVGISINYVRISTYDVGKPTSYAGAPAYISRAGNYIIAVNFALQRNLSIFAAHSAFGASLRGWRVGGAETYLERLSTLVLDS